MDLIKYRESIKQFCPQLMVLRRFCGIWSLCGSTKNLISTKRESIITKLPHKRSKCSVQQQFQTFSIDAIFFAHASDIFFQIERNTRMNYVFSVFPKRLQYITLILLKKRPTDMIRIRNRVNLNT